MFSRIPFVRYAFFLLIGIFAAGILPVTDIAVIGAALGVVVLAVVLSVIFLGSRDRLTRIIVPFSVLLLGWVSANRQEIRFDEHLKALENKDYQAYQVVITSLPEKRGSGVRYEANIEKLLFAGSQENISSEALLYFRSGFGDLPNVGDRLVIYGKLRQPPAANSPFEFDYRAFLARKGIHWTGYLNRNSKVHVLQAGGSSLSNWPARLSEQSDKLFRKYIHDDEAYGVVKAMVLGRRDDISETLNDAFINSGTVHILSVSGLHIAIFFAVLHFVFGFLRKGKNGKYLYLVLVTGILLIYALVTGLPASVQRATLMCIVWMLSTTFSRRHEPVNTLAFSAFLILLADPSALYEVGFQLSFLAMFGIFLLAGPIASIYHPGNRIVRHFWSVSAMSVAAQVMTFPLTVFYFNQFPTYFLLANLLAVDIAGLLIPASFGLLVLGITGMEPIAMLTGMGVNLLANLTNYIVKLPQKLPVSLLEHLYLDLYQCLMLIGFIMAVYALIVTRSKTAARYVLLVAVCFSIYSSALTVVDFRKSFIMPAGRDSQIVFKTKSGHLYLISRPGAEKNYGGHEIKKYMARYGRDTLIVNLDPAARQVL